MPKDSMDRHRETRSLCSCCSIVNSLGTKPAYMFIHRKDKDCVGHMRVRVYVVKYLTM